MPYQNLKCVLQNKLFRSKTIGLGKSYAISNLLLGISFYKGFHFDIDSYFDGYI